MIDKTIVQSAKAVDINKIIDYFQWERSAGNSDRMHCPSIAHKDTTPSCSYNRNNNTVRCFSCGRTFDTINLYQALSEKVNGRVVPFPKAVKEVLELDGMYVQSNMSVMTTQNIRNQNTQSSNKKSDSLGTVLNNSRPITGYELNYLHDRGIMLYDSYVYNGKVYTKQSLDKALQSETDSMKIKQLHEIEDNGRFFEGIAPILKKNRVQIKHNYWQGINSIIYLIDYDYDNDYELQQYAQFLTDTERHMAIQKTMDVTHIKKSLGTSDFIWLAEGIENGNNKVYVCEGMEDALSYVQNNQRAVSLNSIANINSFMSCLDKNYGRLRKWEFVISLDYDKAGQQATNELIQFFECHNKKDQRRKYRYSVCNYPSQYHDINDYWKRYFKR